MPRFAKLRVRVLDELARQLRYESAQAARRNLERAEALAVQLLNEKPEDRAEAYPEEWVVFRITGLRSSEVGGGGMVVRDALLGDLPALIDRLSSAAEVKPEELNAQAKDKAAWLTVDEVCTRLGVSRKSLERYRRKGLVSRRVAMGRGRERVLFARAVVEAFEKRHAEALGEARAFDRMTKKQREMIVRRAARYHARLGLSLHACAKRLAPRLGRTVEAVRQVLLRHDEAGERPIFGRVPPIDDDRAIRLERLSRRGGAVSKAAEVMRRSRATGYRVVLERRAERLRGLSLDGPTAPTFERLDAEQVLCAHASVSRGLGSPLPRTVEEFLSAAQRADAEGEEHESARSAGYWYLRWVAMRRIGALPRHGARSADLDEIETRLLWASRVKTEGVRSQLPLMLRTIDSQAGGALTRMAPSSAAALVDAAFGAMASAFDRYDPFKGGRLAATASVAIARSVSQWIKAHPEALPKGGRAMAAVARADGRGHQLEDWATRMNPWQEWLEMPADLRTRLGEFDDCSRRVLELRAGWSDQPPQTALTIARLLKTTPTRVHAIQRRALAAVHGIAPAPKTPRRKKV